MWFNTIIKWLLLSPLHGMVSKNMMLITFTGRKSGRLITTPVSYIRKGDTLTTTSQKDRTWWRNLRGGSEVVLRLQGKNVKAWSQVSEDHDSVAVLLLEVMRSAPQLARYYRIGLDAEGQPDPQDVAEKAHNTVIICSALHPEEKPL